MVRCDSTMSSGLSGLQDLRHAKKTQKLQKGIQRLPQQSCTAEAQIDEKPSSEAAWAEEGRWERGGSPQATFQRRWQW